MRISDWSSDVCSSDLLPKPFEPRELVLRINAILRRVPPPAPVMPPDKIVFGEFCFDLEREELTRAGAFVRLTTAEASLLKALARRANAFSRDRKSTRLNSSH